MKPLTAVFCDKTQVKQYMKYYISNQEHLQIAEEIGDSGVLMFMQLLRLAATDHPVITDEGVARSLGWTERKAKRYRLALTKFGWYKKKSFTRPDGVKMVTYHIGKESVGALSSNK